MRKCCFRVFIWCAVILMTGCVQYGKESDRKNVTDSVTITLAELNAQIEDNRNNGDLYNRRARLYLNDLQFDKAYQDIRKALSLDENNPSYYITLSDIQLFTGQSQSCLEALNKAIALDPSSREARLKLAKLHLILRNYSATFQVLNGMISQDAFNPQAYFVRAIAFLEKGDTSRAVNDLMKAVDQDQQYFDAYMQLGELFTLKNDPLGEGYLSNALRIRPGNKEALYMLGLYYQNTGRYEKAFQTYDRLSAIAPGFRNAPYNRGYIYLVYLNDFPRAVDEFTKAILIDSGYTDAWFNRGYAQELLGNIPEAYRDFRKTLELDINNEKAIQGLNRLDKVTVRK